MGHQRERGCSLSARRGRLEGVVSEKRPLDEGFVSRVRRRGMRTGFTTGACAAAGARAATQALLRQAAIQEVTIHLPAGFDATFAVQRCEVGPNEALCSIVKDGGDDPDVTHGAEIVSRVGWAFEPGLHLRGGSGVGVVTRPGLGLEVNGPAINPVPRRMIAESVTAALQEAGAAGRGVWVEISVPRGEEMAKKTLNGRLGIVGGISILGTSGVVHPYSTASWRASVEQAIDVGAANGIDHVVLSTGGRSEQFAQKLLGLPELAFVEMGIFTGHALRRAVRNHMRAATLTGMVGKFSKLAQGHFQTHVAGNQVDTEFLADLALSSGAPPDTVAAIRTANTARHVQELLVGAGRESAFCARLAALVRERSRAYVHHALDIETVLFDFDGTVLGRSPEA